jgi:diaminohydroxyphosphoribosylaminopyrimidine deaminase / 5-amino-6-(5-phosphoribosylamino)uracil reductase
LTNELYMRRALELARLGNGYTSPNPMVGCVIVHDDKIIGEGWHQQYGEPHAEVNAIANVADQSLLAKSTVYVTLEPCSHYGKTPPCADLLINHKIPNIVICNTDPNPLVAGRGIKKLLDAGAQVEVGMLEEDGYELNKRFFTFHSKKRPFILLKWAQTSDGYIAGLAYKQEKISGAPAQRLVHKYRSQEQAILVGSRTALYDNPKLNTRYWSGNSPTRIVIDRQLQLPKELHLYDLSLPTFVYTYKALESEHPNLKYIQLKEQEPLLPQIMQDLYQRNILSILVEGGAYLLDSLLKENLWDEALVFVNVSKILGNGIAAPNLLQVQLHEQQTLEHDLLFRYKNY